MGDYFINHDKDTYESTSIMESKGDFFMANMLTGYAGKPKGWQEMMENNQNVEFKSIDLGGVLYKG